LEAWPLKRIGKYEIIGKLGQGAMGVVYKARDPFLQRVVAVKTMSADLDSEPELRERFFREARSAGQLSHKNIITIFDLFEEHGSIYIAMEFLDGEDLKLKIASEEQMPLEYKLQLMIEICEGLDHAHHREIIHRDIKPGNIHITRSGQAKILDFGLARISSSEITKSGLVMGTPNYMSPEQVRGDRVDARSDVFSVGAVFYEFLTYKKPFAASSYHATFYNILEKDALPLEQVEPWLPKELSSIILRALAKEPSKRYQRVGDLILDLHRLEKKLAEKRKHVHSEAKKAVEELRHFIGQNKDLIRQQEPQAEDTTVRLRSQLSKAAEQEEGRPSDVTLGYVEMAKVRDHALKERQRLAVVLQKVKGASVLVEEAAELKDKGRLEDALSVLGKFLKQIPDHAEANAMAKSVRQQIAQRDGEAEQKQKAEELFQKATAKFEEGHPEQCLPLLAEVLKLESDHLGASVLQEQAKQRIQQIAQLEERRRRATEKMASAQKALEAGDLDEAREQVEETMAIDPQATGTIDLRQKIESAEAQRKAAEERAARAEELLKTADSLDRSGQAQQALERLNELLALAPDHPQALKLREKIHERREAREREEKERRAKIAAELSRAREFAKSGKLEDAVHILRDILGEQPRQADAQGLLERIEKEIHDRQVREALQKKCDQLLARAKKMAEREQFNEAVALLEQAKPELAELDAVQAALSDYRAARKRHEETIDRSRRIEQHLLRARESFDKNDFVTSEREFTRLLALDPDHKEAREHLERTRAKIEQVKEEERRARQFREALGAAQVAFTAGRLDQAIAQLEKTYTLDPQNTEVQRLGKQIERRQAEIREREAKQKRAKELETEARRLLKRGSMEALQKARTALEEAVSLWSDLPGASTLQSQIDKQIARAEKKAAAEARRRKAAIVAKEPTLRRAQVKPGASNLPRIAVAGLGFVAVAGVVWLLVLRQSGPSGEGNELAIEPGADPLTATGSGAAEADPALEQGLSAARAHLDQKDYSAAAQAAQVVLERWPENPVAQQILKIADDDLAAISAGIQEVQGLVDAGNLEGARDSLGKVLDLAPSNPDVQALLERLNQYFKQSADRAQNQMNGSKSQAASAQAATLEAASFRQAQQMETVARDLYQDEKFGEATGKFLEASDAYARAERAARRRTEETERANLSRQAETARQGFEQAQDEAVQAGAPNGAKNLFDQALAAAAQAVAKFRTQDFPGAQASYQQATELMNQAKDRAAQGAAAERNRMELAQEAMSVAKRGAPGDPSAEAEEKRAAELAAAGDFAQAAAAYTNATTLYAVAAERGAIARVLEQYRAAYINRDLEALKEIWPGMRPDQAKSLEQTFKQRLKSLRLELACDPFEVAGDSARARCQRTVYMEFANGDKRSFPSTNMFELKKRGDRWFIDVLFGS
jgi:serine/threonine-protein kinase